MAVLWCGSEDLNFQGSGIVPAVQTSTFGGTYPWRTIWGRCALGVSTSGGVNQCKSAPGFPGGTVTSAWIAWQQYSNGALNTSQKMGGVGVSGLAVTSLMIGTGTSNWQKLTLYKWDGTTLTSLASESGASLAPGIVQRIDMQISSYGATATVNVYVAGTLVLTFTGNVAVSGMTNFNTTVFGPCASATGGSFYYSEVIVANEDTRAWASLATLYPNGNGSTQQWTGTYTGVDLVAFTDANPNYVNTTAQDQQFTITALPSGTYVIKAVQISARTAVSAGATPSNIELGFNQSGTVAVGSPQSVTTAYETYDQLDTTNPVTSSPWVQSDLTGIQLDLRSA